ncbi:hypothetical protein SGPA1_22004 [Streptomyces misionensis JCM 4497]
MIAAAARPASRGTGDERPSGSGQQSDLLLGRYDTAGNLRHFGSNRQYLWISGLSVSK